MYTSGKLMPNHMATRAKNVPNGMAVDACFDHIKIFTKKTTTNTTLGHSSAVYHDPDRVIYMTQAVVKRMNEHTSNAFLCQAVPLKALYIRAEKYPANVLFK